MRSSRGFTLIETLVGILILGMVIVTSLLIFVERQKRLRSANERILVWQVLSNEAEVERRIPYQSLDTSKSSKFLSDLTLIKPLTNATTSVTVTQSAPNLRKVVLDVKWIDNKVERDAQLWLVRADTGGGSLW